MTYVIQSRHESRIGIKEASTWGTAASAGDAFKELPNDPGAVFDKGVNLRRPDRSWASNVAAQPGHRIPDIKDINNDIKGAAPTIPISGNVRLADLADLLYLVMQDVTEGAGAGVFLKQFQPHVTQPDFTANAGMFCSVCSRHSIASNSELMGDAIIRDLTLTLSPDANEGRLHYSANFVGRGAVLNTFNPSGTWTRVAETYFYFHDIGTFLLAATPVDIFSIELTISNNAVPAGVEVGGTGDFATFNFPKYTITGKVRFLYTSAVSNTLLAAFASGQKNIWRWYWGNANPAASGDLRFDMACVLTATPRVLEDIHQIEASFEVVTDVVTSGEDCDDHGLIIQLADAVDRGW